MKFSRFFRFCLGLGLILTLSLPNVVGAIDARALTMEEANAKLQKGDFAGAIAGFSRAIIIQPADGEAYLGRAYARHGSRDLPGAIKDYTMTIDLARTMLGGDEWHPALGNMYMNRGKAHQDDEKWSDALLDYDHALKCDPNLVMAYGNRGVVRQMTGDLSGAIGDYDDMIRRAPDIGRAFHMRATARQAQGDFPGAITDFRSVIRLVPEQAGYSHFFIWLLRARLGEQIAANEELAGYFKARPNGGGDDWEVQIANFLLGRMQEEDFLLSATGISDPQKTVGRQCEAWYYCGMKRLLAHERTVALEYLGKCVATDMKDFTEYHLAVAELKALQ